MRVREFAIGAFFLIVGFIIFWDGYCIMQFWQSPLGQIELAYSEEARERYENAQIESTIGGVLALGGFAACLYGAVAEPKKEKAKPRGQEYERHGLTWKRKSPQTPKQTEESVSCAHACMRLFLSPAFLFTPVTS